MSCHLIICEDTDVDDNGDDDDAVPKARIKITFDHSKQPISNQLDSIETKLIGIFLCKIEVTHIVYVFFE